ncbi:hypothetical protein ASJ81_17165 [Methanosarcina spelaei]|uniref:Uncharacterized protein n=1 Tax=Methanosarcina spelaei TaxID=1036679 RepID=A0A2A2HWC3_9EURY|nr:hypothetical protein [Methanosarcina spelaei]PAV13596.1 hypothetical protein ASJ81_17165 [Methanosarcina spelaei]
MRAFDKIILFGMMLTPLVLSEITFACLTDNTFAYFSDMEYSTGNTIKGGTWNNESSFLVVSDSKLTGNGEKLQGITLDVSDTQNVTIDKFQVWWDSTLEGSSHITSIGIDGNEFFSGSRSVGEIVDGEDYLLEAGSSAKLDLYFDSSVSNLAPFTINIVMNDGSVKSFVTGPKYHSDVTEIFKTNQESSQNEQEVEQEVPLTEAEDSQAQAESVDRQEPVTNEEENQNTPEASTIDTKEESQDAKEPAVEDSEEEGYDGQKISVTDVEERQDEEGQKEQESPVIDIEDGQAHEDSRKLEDSQTQEGSVDSQESVTGTMESKGSDTSVIDTEEKNPGTQEAPLEN